MRVTKTKEISVMIKKWISVAMILVFAGMLMACGVSKAEDEQKGSAIPFEGDLTKIMSAIYENSGIEELPNLVNTELSTENIAYYVGTDQVTFEAGLASEPMINAIAHSIVLIKVEDGTDIEQAKETIKSTVDPRKWICVGVEEDKIVVDNIGNLIIVILDEQSEKFHDAFKGLSE